MKLINALLKKAGLELRYSPARKRKNLTQLLLDLPLLRPYGFPPQFSYIVLILSHADLNLVQEAMDKNPQCRLKFIALWDGKPGVQKTMPIKHGCDTYEIPLGKLEDLRQKSFFEFVYYDPRNRPFAIDDVAQKLTDLGIQYFYVARPETIGVFHVARPETIGVFPNNSPNIEQLEQYIELFSGVQDQASRIVLARRIKALSTGHAGYFELSRYQEYFHPALPAIQAGDTIFDAGMGGSRYPTSRYAALVGKQGHVWPTLFLAATQALQQLDNVTVLPFALWNKMEMHSFHASKTNPGGSSIIGSNAEGEDIIQASMVTVDHVMQEKKIAKLDHLKMDIEGAELAALEGSIETIRIHKPNLNICLYHKHEDLLEIPKFIKRLNLGYKMYIGEHSARYIGTCLYATAR